MKNFRKFCVGLVLTLLSLQTLGLSQVSFAVGGGDVAINEIAWMGSADNYNDEWIELYNNSSGTVDLSGWYIEDDGSTVYTIESGEIGPHAYFLVEDAQEATSVPASALVGLSLSNAGDSLVLKDSAGVAIDTVNSSGGAWYAGDSTSKATMERIDPMVDGDVAENWADASAGNGSTGRSGTAIVGTPGSANSNYGGGTVVLADAEPQYLSSGDTMTLSVSVSEAIDLYSYGMEINYDPAVLNFVSASEGAFLGSDGEDTSFNAVLADGAEGTLVVGNARMLNPAYGVDGSGELYSIVFSVVGANGSSTNIAFGGGSFLADSFADMPANFSGDSVSVGEVAVGEVGNLSAEMGAGEYSFDLSWDAPVPAADSYIIRRQLANGAYATVAEIAETYYTDADANLLSGIEYEYQLIAVTGGASGSAISVSIVETRGVVGDNDKSGRVDGRDLENLARSYGSVFGEEEYDALVDSNFDGVIDGSDLIDIGMNFGLSS
ncbi:lamin tail domain-containing protein [Patescibacteria group bacterium]|nr:lamin tail domain-containing protein [Patescibacteria group bacterium]